jgi:hypothetical protein
MDKKKKDLLVFGYGLGLIAVAFAIGGTLKHGFGLAQGVLVACAVVFISVTAFRWEALKPGYTGWMKVAHLIGGVISTLVLSVVYFFIFTPVGIMLKLFGKDHLERKIDPQSASYWHVRPQEEAGKERHLQQF